MLFTFCFGRLFTWDNVLFNSATWISRVNIINGGLTATEVYRKLVNRYINYYNRHYSEFGQKVHIKVNRIKISINENAMIQTKNFWEKFKIYSRYFSLIWTIIILDRLQTSLFRRSRSCIADVNLFAIPPISDIANSIRWRKSLSSLLKSCRTTTNSSKTQNSPLIPI